MGPLSTCIAKIAASSTSSPMKRQTQNSSKRVEHDDPLRVDQSNLCNSEVSSSHNNHRNNHSKRSSNSSNRIKSLTKKKLTRKNVLTVLAKSVILQLITITPDINHATTNTLTIFANNNRTSTTMLRSSSSWRSWKSWKRRHSKKVSTTPSPMFSWALPSC